MNALHILIINLFIAIIGHSCMSHAFCPQPGLETQITYLQKISRIGQESRLTFPEYAKAKGMKLEVVEKAFAATGIINCGGVETSAQLTGKNNVLTTAAHTFRAPDCSPRSAASTCYFKVSVGKIIKRIPLKPETLKLGECGKSDLNNDWATIKLTEKVDGITPYAIPDDEDQNLEGKQILHVAGRHMNFPGPAGDYPKTIEECIIKKVNKNGIFPIQTNCDTGTWASGSGQLALSKKGIELVAIHVATSDDNGKLEGAEYDEEKHFNVSTPVSGAFLAAIKENMK